MDLLLGFRVDAHLPGKKHSRQVTAVCRAGVRGVACAAAGLARQSICEAQNMQYLAELVQHGLGISVLPPMSLRAVTAEVSTLAITPPIRRDICAVVSAGRPPTSAAQALLGLLAANIDRRRGRSPKRSPAC